ncbi:MAG: RNA polymerase sigma factor RpoH [Desulfuromonadales bacterium]
MSNMHLPVATDSYENYMTQINRFALLSRREEHDLAVRYRRDGDLDAAQALVCANLRFVVKIAQEYRNYGLKSLDLIQEGNIGLMMAVKKFDPDRGIRLITYAVWWIRAYMQNFIIKSWSLVKIGTTQSQKKLFFKLNQAREAIKQLTGGEDAAEIARELNVSDTEVNEMSQRMNGHDTSLDRELLDGEGFSLLDTLADERCNQEEFLGRKEEHEQRQSTVESALTVLNDRERRIVEKRILNDSPLTLQEIADDYGISRERVRQLEKNALNKLRETMSGPA